MADFGHTEIPREQWTIITDMDCFFFQNRSIGDVLITQSVEEPIDKNNAFLMRPKENAEYMSDNDKLWAFRSFYGECVISYQKK